MSEVMTGAARPPDVDEGMEPMPPIGENEDLLDEPTQEQIDEYQDGLDDDDEPEPEDEA